MRLKIDKVFYVGGLETDVRADFVSADDYRASEPDPLHSVSDAIIEDVNSSNMEELLIVCNEYMTKQFNTSSNESDIGNIGTNTVTTCRLANIDRLGLDIHTVCQSKTDIIDVRIPFQAPVSTESEARSTITMMAQMAWEKERNYTPRTIEAESDSEA